MGKYSKSEVSYIRRLRYQGFSYSDISEAFNMKFGKSSTGEAIRKVVYRSGGIINSRKAGEAFIKELRSKGLSYADIAKHYNREFGKNKSETAIRKIYYRSGGDTDGYNVEGLRDTILTSFLAMVEEVKHVPKLREFIKHSGTTPYQINKHFGSFSDLEAAAASYKPEVFESIIDERLFSSDNHDTIMDRMAGYKRFVITTAVTGCAPHEAGLKAIQTYCDHNDAMLIVLPCSDPARSKTHKYKFSLDHRIPQDAIVFNDTELNDSLRISTIKLSAKQINPLTGLRRLGRHGSCILASPKQMLEHVPSSNKKGIPRAIMTTGAITVSDYRTEMYMSERTAYLADEDHKLGGLIVELEDDKIFYARRFQIDADTGSFYDINKHYHADGTVQYATAHVLNQPDWHMGSVNPEFRSAAKSLTKLLKPEYMTFEDFFDGCTINPHEKHNIALRAKRSITTLATLQDELFMCSEEISDIVKWNKKTQIVFKYGNHEDFLKRWLKGAEYSDDPANHYMGVCIAKAYLEDHEPFEYAMRELFPCKGQNRITFLGVNDSFMVNGIENGVHGHLGASGKRSPGMVGMEAYGPCTTGHTHSAAILRDVVRVGTATNMQLVYNDGASAWTNTLNIQHYDGARQLVTVINGKWCL